MNVIIRNVFLQKRVQKVWQYESRYIGWREWYFLLIRVSFIGERGAKDTWKCQVHTDFVCNLLNNINIKSICKIIKIILYLIYIFFYIHSYISTPKHIPDHDTSTLAAQGSYTPHHRCTIKTLSSKSASSEVRTHASEETRA